MTQDEAFKSWWHNEGSQAPYTHHDCEEHTMRMCEIAWANGAYKEREKWSGVEAYLIAASEGSMSRNNSEALAGELLTAIRARGQA
jgi:hypothetical protein